MDRDHIIVGIHITDRLNHASEVQKVFSEFGCNIKTRLGLHEANEDYCSTAGLILLELVGDGAEIARMKARLEAIRGLDVKEMVFSHA
jgi:hypothetical protein